MKIVLTTRRSGFTMVEIAISLAVLGFALVAIIGVLPTGLQVQKENREETLINQDAAYLLEAIRGGTVGSHDLTNYVDWITVSNLNTRASVTVSNAVGTPRLDGRYIVGLLTTPKYTNEASSQRLITSRVTARIRSMSGSAVDKSVRTRDVAFAYLLNSEIIPLELFPMVLTNFTFPGLPPEEVVVRSNRWVLANVMADRAYELRLLFRWPIFPNGTVGNGRHVFRTLIASPWQPFPTNNNQTLFFFVNRPVVSTDPSVP